MYQESTENYLETIYILLQRMGTVRSIDVCNEMGYSKPTISVTMKQFREKGYVKIDSGGHITLTPSGLSIAQRIYERHVVLSELLMLLGVGRETALADACKTSARRPSTASSGTWPAAGSAGGCRGRQDVRHEIP